MSQERGEGEIPYCERDASRAGLLEMRPFGEAKSISGHQTLQLMRRPMEWSKGKRVRCHTPCLQKVPKGRAIRRKRRPGSGFPTGRGTGDGHLEAHHDLQARPARPGKATRLGVRGSIVPAAPRTSYSSFFKAGGKGSLFCNGKKRSRFYSAQPNDSSNTNDLCLECVARSLL